MISFPRLRGVFYVGMAVYLLLALAAPSFADVNVFVRFGDGLIISCPRPVAVDHCHREGAVIVTRLPGGYVVDPYRYYGYPAYYPNDYYRDGRRFHPGHHPHWDNGRRPNHRWDGDNCWRWDGDNRGRHHGNRDRED